MTSVFKVGDKVFHYGFGWGKIDFIDDETEDYPIIVMFKSGSEQTFTLDGKFEIGDINTTLSFTEYSVSNFSQERPFELPEIGEKIMVSNDGSNWHLGAFKSFLTATEFPILVKSLGQYKYFKRLR